MKRRDFLSGLAASIALSGPVLAQDYVASVISQLSKMGFRAIRQERTLLGRIRITATRNDGKREIIINPNNGEILRDLWTPVRGEKRASDITGEKSGGGGSGGSGSGDDDDDDDDDDGGNSGSGGGGSGGGGSGGGGSGGSGGGGDDDGDDDEDDDDDDDDDEGDD